MDIRQGCKPLLHDNHRHKPRQGDGTISTAPSYLLEVSSVPAGPSAALWFTINEEQGLRPCLNSETPTGFELAELENNI